MGFLGFGEEEKQVGAVDISNDQRAAFHYGNSSGTNATQEAQEADRLADLYSKRPDIQADEAGLVDARSNLYLDRKAQGAYADQLRQQASGQGPSIAGSFYDQRANAANTQLQQGQALANLQFDQGLGASQSQFAKQTAASNANAMSMANSARGGAANQASSTRQAMLGAQANAQNVSSTLADQNSQAAMGRGFMAQNAEIARASALRDAAAQGGQIRAGEQLGALGQLGGALSQNQQTSLAKYGQDSGLAAQQAQFRLASQQSNDQNALAYRNQRQDVIGRADNMAQNFATMENANKNLGKGYSVQNQQLADARGQKQQEMLIEGAVTAGKALSDERRKEDVSPGERGLVSLLDSLDPKEYKYKEDTGLPQSRRIGFMAQDLEKTPDGAALVTDTPKGKMVDSAQATNTALAGLAMLHERLKKLEGGHAAHS